jgi:hypothetical protein
MRIVAVSASALLVIATVISFGGVPHAQTAGDPRKGDPAAGKTIDDAQSGVTRALDALGAISIGELRKMSDDQLTSLQEVCRQWLDLIDGERKRRKGPKTAPLPKSQQN